ncbi:hypothetical protein OE88DRAFT_518439 [Heliocybe sulcata]|uniref:C2 NT-type domain-containing protein n=1 Tax=Heliocybe sulcata TaxID=5364 RepID=A0A5C3MTM3_9AGAM|nr:hypothetical protein OE88DRAFT_518439 [Heliocybe sulcata]
MPDGSVAAFLLVTNIRVEGLPPVDSSRRQTKLFMRIRSGKGIQDTKAIEVKGPSRAWVPPLAPVSSEARLTGALSSSIDTQSSVSLTLYYRRWAREQIVGSTERSFRFFRDRNGQEVTLELKSTTDAGLAVRIICCTHYGSVNDAPLLSVHPSDDVISPQLTRANDTVTVL